MKLLKILTFILLSSTSKLSEGRENENNNIMEFRIKGNNSTEKEKKVTPSDFVNSIESYTPADFIFNACELGKYKAPPEFMQRYPYYLSGFDEAGRPIWVAEFGRYDLRRITSGGPEIQEAFDEYSNDVTLNLVKSLFMKSNPGRPVFQFIFIIDFEGLEFSQMTIANLGYLIKLGRRYSQMIDEYSHSVVVINVNYVAELLTNMFRPVFGKLFEKVTVFGTNKAKWLPHMRNNFPKSALPEWYGGEKDFQPLIIHG